MRMTKELLIEALKDRFEGWELVEYLQISVEEVVDIFEPEIVDNMDELEEFLNVGE